MDAERFTTEFRRRTRLVLQKTLAEASERGQPADSPEAYERRQRALMHANGILDTAIDHLAELVVDAIKTLPLTTTPTDA